MQFPSTLNSLLYFILLHHPSRSAAELPPKSALKPCSLYSSTSGSFYDLSPLQVLPQPSTADSPATDTGSSWHARGWDYPHNANFTLNICGPVVESLQDVLGVPSHRWRNVSAFYKDPPAVPGGEPQIVSIGQQSSEAIFRGKKLVLNYTGGSPCPELDEHGQPVPPSKTSKRDLPEKRLVKRGLTYEDEDCDEEEEPAPRPLKAPRFYAAPVTRRKSTLLSFLCDRDLSLSSHPSISFIGSPDQCTYFFEVRSHYACGGTVSNAGLGPAGVFAVILGIAIVVYVLGGCAYQRTVMHQRGWKQVPNYGVWAGIGSFVKDMFVILFSSCTRRMPSASVGRIFGGTGRRIGYHRVGSQEAIGRGGALGRGRTADDENRLIDQLDEEWED